MKNLENEIIDLINKTVERDVINLEKKDKDFWSLGIDSIENMNIIFEFQEKYNIKHISDNDYQELNTLTDLVQYLKK